MLELQLPRPMPHAVSRAPPLDFYAPSKLDPTMHLPMPRISNAYEHHAPRAAPRAPLTPPDVRASLPQQGAGYPYAYQLPAIGASRPRSASPPRQQAPPAQEAAQTPRKKWSISPALRIPPTIHTPQEGLPQLAA